MSNTSLNHIAEWCNVLHTHSHTHSFIHNTHTYSHTHTLTLRHTHLGTHTCTHSHTWTHTHTDTHSLCSSCHLYHISLTPVRLMSSACKDRGAQGHSAGGKKKLQTSRGHQVQFPSFLGKFHSSLYVLSVTLHCSRILKEFFLVSSGV